MIDEQNPTGRDPSEQPTDPSADEGTPAEDAGGATAHQDAAGAPPEDGTTGAMLPVGGADGIPFASDLATVDEAEVMLAIEEEFVQLSRDLDRISSLPQVDDGTALARIIKLREEWARKDAQRGPMPAWRERLEIIFRDLIESLLAQSAAPGRQGTVAFGLDSDFVKKHGQALVSSLLTAAAQAVTQADTSPVSLPGDLTGSGEIAADGAPSPGSAAGASTPATRGGAGGSSTAGAGQPKRTTHRSAPQMPKRSLAQELAIKRALKKGAVTREQVIQTKARNLRFLSSSSARQSATAGTPPPTIQIPLGLADGKKPGADGTSKEAPALHWDSGQTSWKFTKDLSHSFAWRSAPLVGERTDESAAGPLPIAIRQLGPTPPAEDRQKVSMTGEGPGMACQPESTAPPASAPIPSGDMSRPPEVARPAVSKPSTGAPVLPDDAPTGLLQSAPVNAAQGADRPSDLGAAASDASGPRPKAQLHLEELLKLFLPKGMPVPKK